VRAPLSRPTIPTPLALPVVVGALLRRMRYEPRLLVLAAVVCAGSFVLAGIPRFLNSVSDAGIQQAVSSAPAHQSGFSITLTGRIGVSADGDSLADLAARGAAYQAGLSPTLRGVVSESSYLVETPGFQPITIAGFPLYDSLLHYPTLRIRYDSDVWEHVTLTAGRMPAVRSEGLRPSEALGTTPADGQDNSPRPVFEVVMTAASAGQLHASVGDRFLLLPQLGQTLPAGSLDLRTPQSRVIVEVVGLVQINDPADAYWFGDPRLHRPDAWNLGEALFSDIAAIAAFDETVYGDLYRVTQFSNQVRLPWQYTWRYQVAGERLDTDSATQIQRDLRNLETTNGPSELLFSTPERIQVRSGLSGIIQTFSEQQRIFSSIMALAVVTLLALSLALVAQLAALFMERRRAGVLLLRGRGASGRQLLAAQITEGALLSLPAALAGLLLAVLLVDGRASALSLPAALVVGAGATLLLLFAMLSLVRPPLGRLLGQRHGAVEASPARRLVIEGVVVLLAVAALVAIRRRGIDASAQGAGVDPYLAATPVLASLAVSLVVLRAFPVPARWLASRTRALRGILAFMALQRVSRQPALGGVALLSMTLAVALSVFALVLQSSIDRGQQDTAWQVVGADYRVESSAPGRALSFDGGQLAGVTATSRAATLRVDDLLVVALEAAEYARVTAGTAAAPDFPEPFTSPGSDTYPAIVAQAWLDRHGLRPGDDLELPIGRTMVRFRIVEGRASFPAGAQGELFLLVPRTALPDLPVTTLYLRAPADLEPALRSRAGDDASVTSRAALLAERRAMPFSRGIRNGFLLTMFLAALFAAAAATVALLLSARVRARDLAHLRTLGLSPRQALILAVLEYVPLALLAGLSGALLGAGMIWLVAPGIDLHAFVGGGAATIGDIPLRIEPWPIARLATGIVIVTLLVVLIVASRARHAHLGRILRVGDDNP
jgi:putative ABC transport system permease protein